MKHWNKIVAAGLSIIMLLVLSVSAFAQETTPTGPDSEKTVIMLTEDATISEVADFVDENSVSIESFTTVVPVGSDEITCGFIISQQDNFSSLWDEFVEQQTALLNDAQIANANNEEILADITAAKQAFESNNVQIATIVCDSSTLAPKAELQEIHFIQEISEFEAEAQIDEPVAENPPVASSRAAAAENWVPTSGSAYVWESESYNDATYLQLNFEWDSASALTGLTDDPDSALEGEIVLYNYEGQAISDNWNTNYAYTTNQPRAYRDTQAFDSPDEVCFTVGCSSAEEFEAGTQYYWYAYGNRTDSPDCDVKVYFQRGHRVLDWNYEDPWNIAIDETEIVIRFTDWNTATDADMSF